MDHCDIYPTCNDTLKDMIGLGMNDEPQGIIWTLYDHSYFKSDDLFYVGWRDYYTQVGGYIMALTNVQLIIETVYQSFNKSNPHP